MIKWLDKIPDAYRDSIPLAIRQALIEDIGTGDLTTQGTIPTEAIGSGTFTVKSNGVVAGLAIAGLIFHELDPTLQLIPLVKDGDLVLKGKIIASIDGSIHTILKGERTALNFLQHMSGIATATSLLVRKIAHTHCQLLDTRKTIPGLRQIDKWAVALGGGNNHRMGLYDMVLIKDNHIAMAGGINEAVSRIRQFLAANGLHNKIAIEVEVKSLKEFKEAIELKVDRIMLDNMNVAFLRKAVEQAGGVIPLEASGNITGETICQIAETGVDYISCGALTHSSTAMDISFLMGSNR